MDSFGSNQGASTGGKRRREDAGSLTHPFHSRDLVSLIVSYCPDRSFVFVAGISRVFREEWSLVKKGMGRGRRTSMCTPETTRRQLLASFQDLGLPISTEVCRASARAGNLPCLCVAVGEMCELDSSVGLLAARRGDVRMLRWLSKRGVRWDERPTCEAAAESGNVNALMWCRMMGFTWSISACSAAARSGSVETLRYAMVEGSFEEPLSGDNNPMLYMEAIREGHTQILRWLATCELFSFLWEEQDVFDKSMDFDGESIDQRAAFITEMIDICEGASFSLFTVDNLVALGPKHFHLVENNFVKLRGYPRVDTENLSATRLYSVAHGSIPHGSLYMFDWLTEKGYPTQEEKLLSDALMFSQMNLLAVFIGRGIRWGPRSWRAGFQQAAIESRTDDLRVVMAQPGGEVVFGNGLGSDLCERAVVGGSLDLLRFCLANTTGPLDKKICQYASRRGNTDALSIAVDAGAPLSWGCIKGAVENGRIENLEYLLRSNCPTGEPGERDKLVLLAARRGLLLMLKYLVSKRLVPFSTKVLETLILHGHPDWMTTMVKWFVDECPEFDDEAYVFAAGLPEAFALKLLYTRTSEGRWKRLHRLLEKTECSYEVEEWLDLTKTW